MSDSNLSNASSDISSNIHSENKSSTTLKENESQANEAIKMNPVSQFILKEELVPKAPIIQYFYFTN